jgi:uncharacterized coiled-coil protein SlyX
MGDTQDPGSVEGKPQWVSALEHRIHSFEKRISKGEEELAGMQSAAVRMTNHASNLGNILREVREELKTIREVRAEYPD